MLSLKQKTHELYHFTTRHALHRIIADGIIVPSPVRTARFSKKIVVCLTSDTNPIGHGLPDGREISSFEVSAHKGASYRNGRYFSADHTAVRMKICIPACDENLEYVPTLFIEHPMRLLSLDIGGYFPYTPTEAIPRENLLEILLRFNSGLLEKKSMTWWFYRRAIPFAWVTEIGFRQEHLEYVSGTREEFLSHLTNETQDTQEQIGRQ